MGAQWNALIDRAIYPVGLMSPVLTYIQAAKIWIAKDASGVSLLAWAGYTVISFVWLNYGAHHRIKPVVLVESLAIAGYVLIVAGAIVYG